MTKASLFSVGLVLGLAKCAYNWDIPEPQLIDIPNSIGDASTSSDARANEDGSVGPSDGGSGDAGLPIVQLDAACSSAVQCAEGSYCRYADENCGTANDAGAAGVCTTAVGCADDAGTDVCACNGDVYPSQCAARRDGFDVSISGACTTPANTFRCGYTYCTSADFCVEDQMSQAPPSYRCESFQGCILGCGCTSAKSACDGGTCAGLLVGYQVTCH